MRTRLAVAVLMLVGLASLAWAQSTVRLRIEILKDGATVGTAEVTVPSGTEASITHDTIGDLRIAPAIQDSSHLRVAFTIDAGGKQFTPTIVLHDQPGFISWSAASREAAVLRVTWLH